MRNLKNLLVITILLASCTTKERIHEWRGKDRTGVYNESGLLKKWPDGGPKIVWSIDSLGNGYTPPLFSEKIFLITGEVDSMSVLYCFNLNGKKVWQTTLGREWTKTFRGSRCTPTIVGDLVYVGTGIGDLYCVNLNTGKVIWSKYIINDFQGTQPLHGYSEAALTDGNKVFWTPGGKEFNVVALDRFTGKLLWSNKGFGESSAYNPGKLIKLKSRNIFATFTMYHFLGFDTETGKLLWSHEQDAYPPEQRVSGTGDTHSNAVLYEDGSIFYVEGDGNCGVRLNLSDDGTKITQVWRNKKFDSYMGGTIKAGNYLYGGSASRPLLMSIDATTGALADSLKIGVGTIIAADNMLYYYNQKGDMNLVSYNEGKLEAVSSFRVDKGDHEHFSHPVINKGILYIRHGNALIAYDIRK